MITSIVAPTYNRAPKLDRLLDSLKPFHLKEILVVDGCSTDNTQEVMERHWHAHVSYQAFKYHTVGTAYRFGCEYRYLKRRNVSLGNNVS